MVYLGLQTSRRVSNKGRHPSNCLFADSLKRILKAREAPELAPLPQAPMLIWITTLRYPEHILVNAPVCIHEGIGLLSCY